MNLRLFRDEPPVFSVSKLTAYIRQMFEIDELVQDVWVEGEVSRPSTSGHLYFTLKDSRSQLKAVMWESAIEYRPQHGEKVRVHGKISVYEPKGDYQLYCKQIEPLDTVGDLHEQFRQLWTQLEAEGLFSEEIKRPLPAFPQRIGIVTSASTAAFQDVQNILKRRYPIAEVILSNTPVQGEDAAAKIIAALELVDQFGVDVILMVRGGGSIEDLWCFNDEQIARAIRQTRAPVVTGVGHETDTTLVDGAADRRAPTPSAAAEIITPDLSELRYELSDLAARLAEAGEYLIEARRTQLDDIAHKLRLVSPASRVRTERQRIDELDARLTKAIGNVISTQRQQVASQRRALDMANPQRLLARGYARITRPLDNKRVTSIKDAAPGTTIGIQLADGELIATVKDRKANEQ